MKKLTSRIVSMFEGMLDTRFYVIAEKQNENEVLFSIHLERGCYPIQYMLGLPQKDVEFTQAAVDKTAKELCERFEDLLFDAYISDVENCFECSEK